MYKRLLLIPLMLFMTLVMVSAQDTKDTKETKAAKEKKENNEIKKKINGIKKSSLYLYGEVTAPTLEEAKSLAQESLYEQINEWVAQKKKLQNSRNIVVNNKTEIFSEVSLPRGNMYRSFIYVKKSDIIAADNSEVIQNNISVMPKKEQAKQALPEAVETLCACTQYDDLAKKIKEFKATGKIVNYARYASLDNPDEYYLAVYNTAGKVVAILSPGSTRKNVKTGEVDNVTNYSGCGAIGFKVK